MKIKILLISLFFLPCRFGLHASDIGITVSSNDSTVYISETKIDTLVSNSGQQWYMKTVQVNGKDVDPDMQRKILHSLKRTYKQLLGFHFFQNDFPGILFLFGGLPFISMALIFLFVVIIPLALIFIIIFSVYQGKKAKERSNYQKDRTNDKKNKEDYQTEEKPSGYYSDKDELRRKKGITTMCIGVGLAILLGIVLKYLGFGVGAVVFFVGLGDYLSSKPNIK